MSREPLNGLEPNSQERRVWSLGRMSLNVRVKGQGHHDKTGFSVDMSGTAELICGKFTRKTYLVRRWDKFEGQGQFRPPSRRLCLENIFALVLVVSVN